MLRVHDDIADGTGNSSVSEHSGAVCVRTAAISLHVHDEIGIDVPKGSYSEERLLSVMKIKEPGG